MVRDNGNTILHFVPISRVNDSYACGIMSPAGSNVKQSGFIEISRCNGNAGSHYVGQGACVQTLASRSKRLAKW